MTNIEEAVKLAIHLIKNGKEVAGHHITMGRLHVIKDIRTHYDMSYAPACMVYNLAESCLKNETEKAFVIKRVYGPNHDYLIAWDDIYGTACGGNKSKAKTFTGKEIDAAVMHANESCVGYKGAPKPDFMKFVKEPI